MGEYSFCDEIKKEYNVLELESKSLSYRIDSFIYACDMDLSDSLCVKGISKTRAEYINKKKDTGNFQYDINFTRGYDHEKGNYFVLLGKYNDLVLLFANYFDKDKNKSRINEIPFHISLGKIYNDYAYQICFETVTASRVKITIKKSKEDEMIPNSIVFQTNISDFSKVLKLVKSFVRNPELVYITYDEIMNRKEIMFTSSDFDVAIINDPKLDEPINKIEKILKKIIG